MRPIDQILQAGRDRRRSVTIPEWGGLELFFAPLTTSDMIAVRERLVDLHGEEPAKHEEERRVLLLIQKAQLPDGSKAFDWGDRLHLQEADYVGMQKALACMYGNLLTLEDAKKKSEETESSSSVSSSG